MSDSTAIVWFKNNLRLHDNIVLRTAIEKHDRVLHVYVFDDQQFGKTSFGFDKTGGHRAKFLLESVADLRKNFQAIGGDLWMAQGDPAKIISALAREQHVKTVYYPAEITSEEKAVESQLENALIKDNIAFDGFWENTLIHIDVLPVPMVRLPNGFTTFRKMAEAECEIYTPLAAPTTLNTPDISSWGELPTMRSVGCKSPPADARAVLPFTGGETAAIKRLDTYIWGNDCLKSYFDSRNGLLGADYSSKFSAWLANGSLSPRYVHAEVKKYERERIKNKSTYWLIFELLWRDFFKFTAAKHRDRLFHINGLKQTIASLKEDRALFDRWANGQTGIPFIDANMRELNQTGFMSNRGRQNVASFLVKDLGINWLMGAEYFESLLIDYDVCSNYGNWAYQAGTGNDPRNDRYFNVIKQGKQYDPDADYIKQWVPELANIPAKNRHDLFGFNRKVMKKYGVNGNYPEPVIVSEPWKTYF